MSGGGDVNLFVAVSIYMNTVTWIDRDESLERWLRYLWQ